MRLIALPAYLVGKRWAILELAGDRSALPVAALLVLSAAIARNFDRASLLDEPWRLAGPFVASLAISGPLFLVIYLFARWKGMESPGIGRAYRAFLTLYWMTAPLAWLYGIPYEMFDTPLDATNANLRTLALVSIWRVALLTRVVVVLFGLPVYASLGLVMLVADIVALVALYIVPVPVLNVMGGIADPGQQTIALAALLVLFVCWATLPVWILLAAVAVIASRAEPRWQAAAQPDRPALVAMLFAAFMLMAWAALLPFTQPEHRLAKEVERVHRDQGPAAAQAVISSHARADFPIDWEPPPPRGSRGHTASDILATLEAIAELPRDRWVAELYNADWVRHRMGNDYLWPEEMIRDHLVRLAAVASKLPQGPAIARLFVSHPEFDRIVSTDNDAERPARDEATQTLKQLAEAGGAATPATHLK